MNLKQLREAEYLTQIELAKKAGISRDTLAKIEKGKRKPSFRTIRKLAKALGVKPGEIDFGPAEHKITD